MSAKKIGNMEMHVDMSMHSFCSVQSMLNQSIHSNSNITKAIGASDNMYAKKIGNMEILVAKTGKKESAA